MEFVGQGAGDFEVGWVVAGDGAAAVVLSVLVGHLERFRGGISYKTQTTGCLISLAILNVVVVL